MDGEWVRGEVRLLGDVKEMQGHHKVGKRITVEDAPTELVKAAFMARLDLKNNQYLADFPPSVQKEMASEVIDMLLTERRAFSLGEQGNDFEEQIGACDWFQYQLILKEL